MWSWIAIAVVLPVVAEGLARAYGFGKPLLYEKTVYGYRVVPGQALTRFGNRVYYNDYGLRSEAVQAIPMPDVTRIICIGDSITFGGTTVDQDETYPYLLQSILNDRGSRFEVLNASAGGWAIENEEGWLQENGILGSRAVILQVATHDLFQKAAAAELVGTHPSFPARRPTFALQELWSRYLWPRLAARFKAGPDVAAATDTRSMEDVTRTLASIARIAQLTGRQGARLLVLFVEEPVDTEPDDELTRKAKQSLFAELQTQHLPLIRPIQALEQAGGGKSVFRDGVHPNAMGNRVLAEEVAKALWTVLQEPIRQSHGTPAAEIRVDAGTR